MSSTYSMSLRMELVGTGDQTGNWGTTLNYQLGTLLEQAITGHGTVNLATDADYTLTTAQGTVDQARNAVLIITSAVPLTATRAIIIPAVPKLYTVRNNTTGGQSISIKTATGVGCLVAPGACQQMSCDGTNTLATSSPAGSSVAFDSGPLTVTGQATVNGKFAVTDEATFGGAVVLAADPGSSRHAASKNYVDVNFLALSGGFIKGNLGAFLPNAPTTGALFLGNSGARYLQYDGTSYQMPGSKLFVNGAEVYTTATLSLTGVLTTGGGNLTGPLVQGSGTGIIRGDGFVGQYFQANSGTERGLVWYDSGTNTMRMRCGGGGGLGIDPSGNAYVPSAVFAGSVYIGTAPRGAGSGRAMMNSDNRFGTWSWGGTYVAIDVDGVALAIATSGSDERLKTDITPAAESALDKIEQLEFVDYRFKPLPSDPEGAPPKPIQRGGIIAQQARAIEPEWVHVLGDAQGTQSLDTMLLLTNALQAIKELSAKVTALEARVA